MCSTNRQSKQTPQFVCTAIPCKAWCRLHVCMQKNRHACHTALPGDVTASHVRVRFTPRPTPQQVWNNRRSSHTTTPHTIEKQLSTTFEAAAKILAVGPHQPQNAAAPLRLAAAAVYCPRHQGVPNKLAGIALQLLLHPCCSWVCFIRRNIIPHLETTAATLPENKCTCSYMYWRLVLLVLGSCRTAGCYPVVGLPAAAVPAAATLHAAAVAGDGGGASG